MGAIHNYNSVAKTFASISLIGISLVAIVFGIWTLNSQQNQNSARFAADSLQAFKELNYKHEMVIVEDLLDDSDSRMISSLYKANVLFSPGENMQTYKGLLITVEDDRDQDSVLLLEPIVELSDEKLNYLANEYEVMIPEFSDVEIDQELVLSAPVYRLSPDTFRQTKIRTYDYFSYKNPVRVAVIDSGVDPDHEIFDDLHLQSGWNTLENSLRMYDDVGHGTHIAGIIRMNAPNAIIVPYKIVDINGGRLSNVIKAFDKAIDTKVDIINTSFGVLSPSTALRTVAERAEERHIIIVSAAGNLNTTKGFYPATFDSTIAVAGVDNFGRKMAKSNYGYWVDIASYGNYIWSSLPGNDYGHKSGTSQATAYVTAAIVRLIEEGKLIDRDDAIDLLEEDAAFIANGPLAGLKIVK